MKAVGGYFEGLRLAHDYSQAEVAAALKQRLGRNVSASTVWKIESGSMTPKTDLLLAMIDALGASVIDIWELMQDKTASEAHGKEMGRLAAGRGAEETIRDAWRKVPAQDRDAARARILAALEEN